MPVQQVLFLELYRALMGTKNELLKAYQHGVGAQKGYLVLRLDPSPTPHKI